MALSAPPRERLQLWGGVECTVNRVGDRYHNQLERNGHHARIKDLERFAGLGIEAIRYPVLWERTWPEPQVPPDWRWSDARLARLRELCVHPIVGLVHHGSGPSHTSLVDDAFPEKLADYARQVAARYPWVDAWTPVNEPLTTARFSALYGAWYPHARDPRQFWRALANQCRGTILAMRAIQESNPAAQLVQTDDLGKTYSTPHMDYLAAFYNERRWLGWDLLTGRVDQEHAMHAWLTQSCGATEAELAWFRANARAPDIVGINYYITSDRYLDEDCEKYPEHYRGSNDRGVFADMEMARCVATPSPGIAGRLAEAWERYRLPLAITEVHIDATRDDQLRWLAEVWQGALQAKNAGADVRALTVWALLGSFDWNCLVTESRGYYESGAFDVRSGSPRPTALARMMRSLAKNETPRHPVLSGPGWWRRADRFLCPPLSLIHGREQGTPPVISSQAPVLITGGTGTLGSAFARLCEQRGLNHRLLRREDMDIADGDSIARALDRHQPWAVINAAGYVRVDDAERDVERCFRENALGPEQLALHCARHGLPLVTFSTDLVFDGSREAPYIETDATRPLNVYGRSKAEGEARALERHPESLVVRTSSFFGPWDQYNFVTLLLRSLQRGERFVAAGDLTVSPTYVPDLASACLDLLIDCDSGIWHLTHAEPITWAELARRSAALAGFDPGLVEEAPAARFGWVAPRPRYSALRSGRGSPMPSLANAMQRYFTHYDASRRPLGRE